MKIFCVVCMHGKTPDLCEKLFWFFALFYRWYRTPADVRGEEMCLCTGGISSAQLRFGGSTSSSDGVGVGSGKEKTVYASCLPLQANLFSSGGGNDKCDHRRNRTATMGRPFGLRQVLRVLVRRMSGKLLLPDASPPMRQAVAALSGMCTVVGISWFSSSSSQFFVLVRSRGRSQAANSSSGPRPAARLVGKTKAPWQSRHQTALPAKEAQALWREETIPAVRQAEDTIGCEPALPVVGTEEKA